MEVFKIGIWTGLLILITAVRATGREIQTEHFGISSSFCGINLENSL